MKNKFVVLGFFVIMCVIFVFCVNQKSDKNSGNASDMPPMESKSNLMYVVKEYNGNIAVFEENCDIPFKITDVRLSDFPDEDKKLLNKGIEASSSQELNCILEDYCS